jgi:hypothetical protein
VIGGVTRDGWVLSNTVEGNVRSEGMVAFLKYALASIAGKVIVVLDNARIHRSKLVKDSTAGQPALIGSPVHEHWWTMSPPGLEPSWATPSFLVCRTPAYENI